jgi:hypothetical protein
MKIEINLNDIMGDEYGDVESLAESIRRQITKSLSEKISEGIKKRVEEEVEKILEIEIKQVAKKKCEEITNSLIDEEYTPTDNYGRIKEKTTMRNQFIKTLVDEMQYKRTGYDSEKNYFTRAVDDLTKQELSKFQKEYTSIVNQNLLSEAMEYALKKLNEKVVIKQ